MTLNFLPFHEAHDEAITEAIASVMDDLSENSPLPGRIWTRVEAVREKNYPSAADIIMQNDRGVGISGWFPLWTNPYGAWSSATYLARHLRGRGLLKVLRCRQCHSAEQIQEELEAKVEFVSSIETTNIRSLRATLNYGKINRWANEWYLYDDRPYDRMLFRYLWPKPEKMNHECFLGRELKFFEDVISEPAIEIAEDTLEEIEMKLKVTQAILKRRGIDT